MLTAIHILCSISSCARRRLLDLANTSALLDDLGHVLQRCELVLVRGLSKVADLGNVLGRLEDKRIRARMITYHSRRAKIVLRAKVGKSVKFVVTIGASVGAVFGNDETVGAQCFPCITCENIAFNENLVVTSAVDSLVQEILVQVVVDMLVTEAASGATSAGIPPVVVVVSDVQVAKVDSPECIAVSNQRTLPVVMEVVPRHSNPIRGADNVELSVVVIRANFNRDLRAEL